MYRFKALLLIACVVTFAAMANAAVDAATSATLTADRTCKINAVKAAEQAYGNSPHRVVIKTVKIGVFYKVTVGIGNPEDGPHMYDVYFSNGCHAQPQVRESRYVPIHPLQNAAHLTYGQLVAYNRDLPASAIVSPATLPPTVVQLYAAREANLKKMMAIWGVNNLAVAVYRVPVANQVTYAVWMPNLHDSIRAYFTVVDAQGREIDEAAVYTVPRVGANGVTWQNETVQQ